MLIVLFSALFAPHRAQITQLAIGHRLPSMYICVEAGGLMSYEGTQIQFGGAPLLTWQKSSGARYQPTFPLSESQISKWR